MKITKRFVSCEVPKFCVRCISSSKKKKKKKKKIDTKRKLKSFIELLEKGKGKNKTTS